MLHKIILAILLLLIGIFIGYKLRTTQILSLIPESKISSNSSLVHPQYYQQKRYYFDDAAGFSFYDTNGWEVEDELKRPGENNNMVANITIRAPYVYTGKNYLERFSDRVIIEVSPYTGSSNTKTYLESLPDVQNADKHEVVPVKLGSVNGYKVDFTYRQGSDTQHRIYITAIKNNKMYKIMYFGSSDIDPVTLQNNPEIEKQAMDLLSSFEIK